MSNYNVYDEKKCDQLRFDYYPGSSDGEYPERYESRIVGFNGVVKILEHPAGGEGDKHWFDVIYENDRVERVFNPHTAYYDIVKPQP